MSAGSGRAVGACALAAVGAFLPWVTLTTVFGSLSVSGMVGDGKVSLVLAAATAVLVLSGALRGARVVAWLGVAMGIFEFVNLQAHVSQINGDIAHAEVGLGVYVTAAAFIAAVVFITKAVRARKAATALLFAPPVLVG